MSDATARPAGEQGPSPWTTYRRLIGYARPYWPLLALAGLGMVVESAAAGAFTAMMKPVVNETFIARDPKLAATLPLVIVGLFLLRGVATLSTDYGMARAGRSIVRDLRRAMLAKYLRLPCTAFDQVPVPHLVSRLNYDTEQVAQASTEAIKVIVTDTLLCISLLAVMIWNSAMVTLGALVMAPLIAAIMRTVSSRYRRLNRGVQDGVAEMAQSAEQTLAGHQEVRIYGARTAQIAHYEKLANRNLRLNVKIELTRGVSSSLVQMSGAVALALILFMAGHEALAGRMNAGQFVSLMLAMMALIPSLRRITNVQSAIQRGIAASQHIFGLLDQPEERDDGKLPLPRARGELVFEKVTLRYHGQNGAALDAISFTARPGTVTAIVGRSGSGKTSLVRLIPRFYEPAAGAITLDGVSLADYPLADLRKQIALVGQRVMLFDDSVAANIAYGDQSDAEPAAIRAAADAANASEFIDKLPQGVDSRIGENGGLLSGGQRQRLAIARAILKDAPILILDEATAALDNESERLVQDALDHLIPDRTTLVIAHRLSTIEHADQVLVLDEGRLVEQGTHAQLLAQGGLYAHLHRMQFRETPAT
ncbi:MAG: lipid A export permease/ATP-binding protein MsbA [Proteobacteria bacterium]|nr:lipid A export permease/ATP-binding protein MsbA [Pseudomonadota bacterium]